MDELEDVLVNQQESLFPAVLVGPEEEDEDEDDEEDEEGEEDEEDQAAAA